MAALAGYYPIFATDYLSMNWVHRAVDQWRAHPCLPCMFATL